MGGKRRRRSKVEDKECASSAKTDGDGTDEQKNDGVLVLLEPSSTSDNNDNNHIPPAWSIDFVKNIEKNSPPQVINGNDDNNNIPSVTDVGLQMVRGTLQRISSRNHKNKKSRKNTETTETSWVKPTPIQLRMWPALLKSFESSKSCDNDAESESSGARLNVVGIAPTGSGKTMSYAIPIISHCIRTLLCQMPTTPKSSKPSTTTMVHGLVIVPTRELAIQVSKEFKVVAKVANKYLTKCAKKGGKDGGGESESSPSSTTIMKVESMAVYGGVEIESQISLLLGKEEDASGHKSLVVSATAGRLLDILKQSDSSDDTKESVLPAFSNLQTIVFDEADRIAVNADMAGQVDEILALLKSARVSNSAAADDDVDVVTCLVSATLPEKAQEMCEKWVPRSRIVVKIDSVKVGEKKRIDPPDITNTKTSGDDTVDDDGSSPAKEPSPKTETDDGKKRRNLPQNLDLASIPSNIVQTLHVCSAHKKPKKLILTLARIYLNKDAQGGRFSANNRLCIVFFAQISTLRYVSKLLVKEGLRCNELYGSLHQTERDRRLLEFKAGKRPILLATDVAARGLHINNVNYVVNYDFPGSLDQYVHRCGRAGRKQSLSGEVSQFPPTVYSFFTREFNAMADSVVELLQSCKAWVDPNLLALTSEHKASAKGSKKSGRKRKKKNNDSAETETKIGEKDVESDNDDQFAFLGKTSVLKRASHVSDAEDSDEDSS